MLCPCRCPAWRWCRLTLTGSRKLTLLWMLLWKTGKKQSSLFPWCLIVCSWAAVIDYFIDRKTEINIFLAQHRVWWCEAFLSLTQKWNKNEDVSIYQPWRMPSDYWDKNMVFNLSSAWCVCLLCHITFAVGKCAKVVWGKYKKDLSAEVFSANENM